MSYHYLTCSYPFFEYDHEEEEWKGLRMYKGARLLSHEKVTSDYDFLKLTTL